MTERVPLYTAVFHIDNDFPDVIVAEVVDDGTKMAVARLKFSMQFLRQVLREAQEANA